MKVKEILTRKPIVVDAEEKISKVLEKMEENRIHQIPVLENGKFIGFIFLKKLIKRRFFPERSKAKNFIEKVPELKGEEDLEDAIKTLLFAGVRALPVVENSKLIGIVSERDLIKHVKVEEEIPFDFFKKDIVFGNIKDKIGKIKSLMGDFNISRVPIKDEDEKIIGCVDNLSLIKLIKIPKESQSFSKISKEKISIEKIPIRDLKELIRETCLLKREEFSLKEVIKKLQRFEEVILIEDGKEIGIITPKDVLGLIFPEGGKVIIPNAEELDRFDTFNLSYILQNFLNKIEKRFKVRSLKVKVRVYSKAGKKKYSLHANLKTEKENFFAKSYGWKITDAAHSLVNKLNKILVKDKMKEMDRKRGKPRA